MNYYPVYLNLRGKKAVVAGGGNVAERKALALLKAGAAVAVVSPELTERLGYLKKKGKITHIRRQYKKGDLRNAFIVVACTSSEKTNTEIARNAKCLVNVVGTPSEGNFIVPSTVKRGHLTIAVSTGGVSPAVSKAIRKELEKLYGREFAHYLRALVQMRRKAIKKIKDIKKRRKKFKDLASEEMFNILRSKGFKAASEKVRQLFDRG
ncbi:MAG: bifunctional precorrin-2 dehydrogenase/sirohydrochlorin ferrochelatase [Nitrospirae bacterium]|nr:bifunctional precorrin-2 dehydrogenase/sirohydrochlorin ferrochelatase [Nitrospirota bacterium]